jgi:sodium/hydrogen exchanger 8
MGMGVFTGRYSNFDVVFTALAMIFCWVGRFFNIFPLSWLANLCRDRSNSISLNLQCVLWFVGLRGASKYNKQRV